MSVIARAECDKGCGFFRNHAPGPCRLIGCGGTVRMVKYVPADQLAGAVEALTTIRDAMRGWTEGGVAELGPDEVFKVADDALGGQ